MSGPILKTPKRVAVSCPRRGVPLPLITKNSAVVSLTPILTVVEKYLSLVTVWWMHKNKAFCVSVQL